MEKLADELVERISELLGKATPVKKIRSSQIFSALVGVIGFSIFVAGIDKLVDEIPVMTLLIIGFVLMIISGALIKNLWR